MANIVRNEINRGHDVWADVETGHLQPRERRAADEAKAEIIEEQRGRLFLPSPFDSGKIPIRDKVVEDLESFRNLCRAGLDVLQKGPTVVVLETRGKSNLWVALGNVSTVTTMRRMTKVPESPSFLSTS